MSARAEAARERIAERLLPGGERSWIDLAVDAARDAGCSVDAILSGDRHASIVRGRHAWWAALRRERYSYPEIASGVGVDHTSVISALKKLGPPAAPTATGFSGMGAGAGI